MRILKFTTLLVSIIPGIMISFSLHAQSDTASTIALSNKLVAPELKMYELAFYLLDKDTL